MDKKPFEGVGLAPDIDRQTERDDGPPGNDAALERAMTTAAISSPGR